MADRPAAGHPDSGRQRDTCEPDGGLGGRRVSQLGRCTMQRGKVAAHIHAVKLDDINEVFADLKAERIDGRVVVDFARAARLTLNPHRPAFSLRETARLRTYGLRVTRAAFTHQTSKTDKASRGKTPAHATPVNVRSSKGLSIPDELREHIRTRLGRQLGRFAMRIERASVRFEDPNGPRGGRDAVCRIKIVLSGIPSVVKEERAGTPREAFDLCANASERIVRRTVERAAVRAGKKSGARSLRRLH
jgi:ribosome-associated translation inhibitor RaiA